MKRKVLDNKNDLISTVVFSQGVLEAVSLLLPINMKYSCLLLTASGASEKTSLYKPY